MFYNMLSGLNVSNNLDHEAVLKFESWLGNIPADFKGSLDPTAFAHNYQVDCNLVAALFNEACTKKVLKICFERICPVCGKCLGDVCSQGCQERCSCGDGEKNLPWKIRFSYHLNTPAFLN